MAESADHPSPGSALSSCWGTGSWPAEGRWVLLGACHRASAVLTRPALQASVSTGSLATGSHFSRASRF